MYGHSKLAPKTVCSEALFSSTLKSCKLGNRAFVYFYFIRFKKNLFSFFFFFFFFFSPILPLPFGLRVSPEFVLVPAGQSLNIWAGAFRAPALGCSAHPLVLC